MSAIPLQPVPAQSVKTILGGQNCLIRVYQKTQGLFVDLVSDGQPVVTCVIARDAVPLVCREYVGFVGNLIFVDTQGDADTTHDGLGSRFILIYITAEENEIIQ